MPIVPSRAERIRALVARLASERPAERDSAVAQLTLLGSRVVEPLRASLVGASPGTRLAALEVLERLEDRRAFGALLALTGDADRAVALRAIELVAERPDPRSVPVLAGILGGAAPPRRRAAALALSRQYRAGLVEALDPLVDTVVDEDAETRLRRAVLDLLLEMGLPRSTATPLGRRLAASSDPAVAARATGLLQTRGRRSSTPDLVERLARGEVSEDEARTLATGLARGDKVPLDRLHEALERTVAPRSLPALATVLGTVGSAASIPVLARTLARLADSSAPGGDAPDAMEARAALHSALAALDSSLALHDLRELIARHPPDVMPRLLDAASRVGNPSLVPALARAATEDPTLAEPCAAAYAAIARRAKLRRSSAALRRVRPEHRAALEAFVARSTRGGRR